jgi:hypothetical protein
MKRPVDPGGQDGKIPNNNDHVYLLSLLGEYQSRIDALIEP